MFSIISQNHKFLKNRTRPNKIAEVYGFDKFWYNILKNIKLKIAYLKMLPAISKSFPKRS